MARVYHRKARKDYPDHGIAKSDLYYYTKIKTGPRSSRVLRSKTPFRRSQLTSSEYLGTLYDIEDSLAVCDSVEDARDLAGQLETLAQETQEKFDNMPEGLQEGDTGQMLQERVTACEEAAGQIEEIVGEWESAHDSYQTELQEYEEAKIALAEQGDATETDHENLEEPEEPDESDFIARVQEITIDA